MFGLDSVLGGGSNLLGGLLGGGGGGLLGTVGGIAGSFFGPIGGMVGSAVGNMLQDAIGDATKDVAKQLHEHDGMPKFLLDDITKAVTSALGPLKHHGVDAGTAKHCQDKFGTAMKDFQDDLTKTILDIVRNQMKGAGGDEDAKPSKKGSGSWMQAIAKAMGQTIGQKASKMVELSDKISSLTAGADGAKAGGGQGMDPKDAAAEAQKANTEFQATSQEFNLLATTFSTAMKALGESMSTIARKQ